MAGQASGSHRQYHNQHVENGRDWCNSENSSYIAVILGKNRVRVYDRDGELIEENKVVMRGGIGVLGVGGEEKVVRGKRKGKGSGRGLVIAMGSSQGEVVVCECGGGDGKGMSERKFCKWNDGGRRDAVNAMVVSKDGKKFWFCLGGSVIICLRLTEGDRGGGLVDDGRISVGAYHGVDVGVLRVDEERGRLWVAGQGITVHDLRKGSLIRQFAGHASPVVDLVLLKDGKALSACSTDQYISLWDCNEEGEAAYTKGGTLKIGAAVYTFLTPTAGIRGLAVDTREQVGLTFGAIGNRGVAVWRNWVGKSSDSVSEADTIISNKSASIHYCCWTQKGILTTIRGAMLKPNFCALDIRKQSGEMITLPELEPAGLLATTSIKLEEIKERERKRLKARDGKVASPDNGDADGKHLVAEMEAMEESDDDDEDEGEATLQERLAQLGVSQGAEATEAGGTSNTKHKSAETLVSVFTQAVDTQDRALFDQILYSSHTSPMIQQTVERMQPSLAIGKFFQALVERFVQSPIHTRKITTWIREVLTTHASLLMSQPNNKSLRLLKDTIKRRVESLESLTRLEGRLELVLAQAERIKRTRVSVGKAPIVEYTEVEQMEVSGGDDIDSSDPSDGDGENEGSSSEESAE